MSKYDVPTPKGKTMDVYDVLVAFNVTNPALQHAIKKMLMPGKRGHKDVVDDLSEASISIDRAIWIELDKQNGS